MPLDQATHIILNHNVYSPAVIPVDYGGTLVCSYFFHLSHGEYLCASSLQAPREASQEEKAEFACKMVCKDCRERLSRHKDLAIRCDYLDVDSTIQYRKEHAALLNIEYLVSACLCGEHCRYDGKSNIQKSVAQLVSQGRALAVCPELFGGLPTPRPPCEIFQGKVYDVHNQEQTAAFLKGAQRTLDIAKKLGIKKAILKEKSPSCGVHFIYDGSFSASVIPGQGLTARLLSQHGVTLLSENDL